MFLREKRKIWAIFWASIIALFATSVPVSALQLSELEPKVAEGAKIELNQAEEPYDFDATLLDKNQTIEYNATITNDSAYDIEVESVEINNSSYDFLEYFFADISNSDIINASDSKTIKIFVKTNNKDTSTVDEDLNLQIHYKELESSTIPDSKPENPNTYAGKAILSVVAVATGVTLFVIFKKSSRIRIGILLFSLPFLGLLLLSNNANAESDLVFNILGKVRFINSYTVTIDPNGGIYNNHTEAYTETVRDGYVLRLGEPSRDTYTFREWTADTGEIINDTITITQDTVITAQWDEIYHTVSVDPNGGSYNNKTIVTEVSVRDGETFHIGDDPIRNTFTFQGWNIIPNELNPNEDIVVTQDISFKALWDENYFNVTIDPNGGTYLGHTTSYTEPYRENDIVTMQTPIRNTYRFVGWTMSVGELDNNKFSVVTDVTLTAQWEEIYYTVTINPNGGTYNNSTEPDVRAYRAGYELTIGAPERNTYRFTGWTAEPNILGQDNKLTVTSDVTITANWEEIYYTLTIDPNGGVYGEHTSAFSEDYRAGTVITIDTPERDTYSFSGWNVQGSPIESNQIILNSDTIITAQWGEIIHTLTVRPNGGTYGEHNEDFSQDYHEGDTIDILTPTRDTYNFTGWTEEGDSVVNNQITLTQDTTITANWEEIYYTLTIDPNGGTYGEHASAFSEDYRAGTYADLSTPTKTGCDFAYWKLEDDSEYTSDSIQITRNITLVAQYTDQYFDITINPNGGKFNNSTEIYSDRVKYGTVIDLTNTEYSEHEIRDWTKNSTETLPADITEIEITADTDLVINWWSSIFYTITINPNEGLYLDSPEIQEFQARKGEPFTVEEATRERYALSQWTFEDDSVLGTNPFVVDGDHTLTAHWFLAIAKNKRTGKLYPSIMTAHDEANPTGITGDTIILLTDTTEVVTNTKEIILDLNEHTVTGYITNTASGNLTLINGEINNYSSPIISEDNPSHAAVINNGTLTMGIDDYTSDGTVNILRNNIRLIGTEIGLLQNNKFYFYDGFIEGEIGLDGGYDGSPFYINTFDGTTIYYFPLVTHNDVKDCQHVELMNADRAVSKTTEHGDIYYYNLQDNINTSTKTGYKIYAIRNFDASYPITVTENADITFDIDGYVVSAGDDWTIDGKLTITDGKASAETGALRASRPITNNNELVFTNAKATALSANTLINNNKNLTLTNSTLSSEYGYTLEVNTADTKLTMDKDSYIRTSTKDIYAVHNQSTNFVINGGNIIGLTKTVLNESNAKLTIKDGYIATEHKDSASYSLQTIKNSGELSIEGGKITSSATDSSKSNTAAVYNSGNLSVSGGEISCYSVYSSSTCLGGSGASTISGGIITSEAKTTAVAFQADNSNNKILDGTISATSNTSTAQAISCNRKTTISGGKITSTAKSNKDSTAVRCYSNYSYAIIDGDATIRAYSNGGVASGVYAGAQYDETVITAGDIYGDTYGLRLNYSTSKVTIGIDDNDTDGKSILTDSPTISGGQYGIYNGAANFYDGVLYGGVNAASENAIRQIPHDATTKTTEIDGTEKTWLEHNEDYLLVDGNTYNSFTLAYEAAKNSTSETKLITAIKNHTSTSALPTIEKGQEITLNLNGFTLQYTQTLTNNGSLTIVDKDNTNSGTIENINVTSTAAITNYGTLTQNGGTIKGRYVAIYSNYSLSIGSNIYTTLNAGNVIADNTGANDTTETIALKCYYSGNHLSIGENSTITVTTKKARAVGISSGTTEINGGTISVSSENAIAYVNYGGSIVLNSGTATSNSNKVAYGFYDSTATVKGGSITAESTSDTATGIHGTSHKVTIEGGTITGRSTTGSSYGVRVNNTGSQHGSFEMTGGSITATSGSGTAIGASLTNALITGGSITGDTYGIDGYRDTNVITLGKDDGTIINGQNASPIIESHGEYVIHEGYVNFYDGVLKGENPYTTDTIKAIPDGATFHNETISDINHCWLEYGEAYLRIEGKDSYYSLTAAYEDAEDGDTIEVIADYVTQADLPANPAGKTITIDLHGHHLSYYQNLPNEGTMIITDLGTDPDKVGILENINPVGTPTIQNGSSRNSSAKLEIRGGIITSPQNTIYNYGTLEVFDGEISCEANDTTSGTISTINNRGTVIIPTNAKNPTIKAISTDYSTSTTAIHSGTVEINKGSIISESATNNSATGIYDAKTTINGGSINSSSKGTAYGINAYSNTVEINDGSITANSSNSSAYGVSVTRGKIIMASGTINSKGKSTTYGLSGSNGSYYRGTVEMSGGSVTASSTNDIAYGVSTGLGSITGGTIHGGTYGLYTNYSDNEITIGDNTDGALSITSPEIIGDTYAVYNGSINFYDGVLKGALGTNSGANFDNNIKQIADDTTVYIGSTTIDGEEYEVKYLIAADDVVITNETTKYHSLYEAVEASVPGDTIRLLEDNYVFHKIVVDEDQAVTINLDGHTIVSGNPITNNGKLTLKNNDASVLPVISYHDKNNFIINTQLKSSTTVPELTLENVEIHSFAPIGGGSNTKIRVKNSKIYADYGSDYAMYGIDSRGDVYVSDNSYIYGRTHAITSSGGSVEIKDSKLEILKNVSYPALNISNSSYTIDHSEILADYYQAISVSNSGSSGTIKNNSTINGSIYFDGSLSILDSTVSQASKHNGNSLITSNTADADFVISNSTFIRKQTESALYCPTSNALYGSSRSMIESSSNLVATNITMHHYYVDKNTCAMSYIRNNGTASIDGLTVDNDDSEANSTNRSSTGIVNNGQITIKNANIAINRGTSYGIYTLDGELTLLDSTISVNGTTAYGAYIDDGNLVMGIPEPVDSPNYGTENADVSTTSPSVTAIGTTTGIGIYKDTGKFKYYDGIITGSTSAIPRDKITSDVEHLYEPTFHTDLNGRDVCILTWMREQPSQPSGE